MDKQLLLKMRKTQYLFLNFVILLIFSVFYFFYDSPNVNRVIYIALVVFISINIVRYLNKKEIWD